MGENLWLTCGMVVWYVTTRLWLFARLVQDERAKPGSYQKSRSRDDFLWFLWMPVAPEMALIAMVGAICVMGIPYGLLWCFQEAMGWAIQRLAQTGKK